MPSATKTTKPVKRKRTRKVRTEVSSSSSSSSVPSSSESSSDSEAESAKVSVAKPEVVTTSKKVKRSKKTRETAAEDDEDQLVEPAPSQPLDHNSKQKIAEDFSSYYLRTITAEFAEDIDKLRSAGDFSAASVPLLVAALQQGEVLFTDEEKRMIVRGKS